MLVELDEKRRRVEEVNTVDEEQLKTVLTMMLDDETRRYTAKEQRGTYAELRRAVNEFLSVVNVVGVEMSKGRRQSDRMDIGRIERANDPWYVEVGQDGLNDLTWGGLGTGDWDEALNDEYEGLNQLGKGGKAGKGFGKSQCFECGE